jgi:sucrose phosphorylase
VNNKIIELLNELNPEFESLYSYIESEITRLNKDTPKVEGKIFSHEDTMLITYADQFSADGKSNFEALNEFLSEDLKGIVNTVHILPFYPWTSDDGFSPIDYKEVDENYGTWENVKNIKFKKMFDCVFNHVSSENPFFKKALSGDEAAQKMFHIFDEAEYKDNTFQENIKKVVRPRTLPLFSEYKINNETKYVWTTFSADQVDTNLSNKDMMMYLLESFFLYIDNGATFFRVDAVPFMWKELGTNCSHLKKTHTFVQLLRAIMDELHSNLYLVTESNVPHHENISYWGNGNNEAHIIYNFSLAPLILHGLTFETNKHINKWGREVFDIHPETTFLNFTSTHDGIGMRGLEGIVPESDVEKLCEIAVANGGKIGKKRSRDGSEKPYELNITWASFLKDKSLTSDVLARKIINSHAIVMFFPGIGAHYAHNFFGSENWQEGFKESGIARRLNRKKLSYPLEMNSFSEKIKNGLLELIQIKNSNELFSPEVAIRMHDVHGKCLCFERFLDEKSVRVYFNLSAKEIEIDNFTLKAYELKIV